MGVTVSPDELLDGPAIRYAYPDIAESLFRVWTARGHLQPKGRDDAGRRLYRWGDVEAILERSDWRIAPQLTHAVTGCNRSG